MRGDTNFKGSDSSGLSVYFYSVLQSYLSACHRVALKCECEHRIEINRKATRVGTFEVCVSTHVSLRIFIMQVLASQLPFLANRNAELAFPPLFWPDNCIKIGGHVALLSGPTVYTLYCGVSELLEYRRECSLVKRTLTLILHSHPHFNPT